MPRVYAEELLERDDLPDEVRKVIKDALREQKRSKKVEPRRRGFHIVGQASRGTEVQPGMRTYEDGTDRTYRGRTADDATQKQDR